MRRQRRIENKRTEKKRAGFTLLEVLIVLAIIGVIAAMAVPRLLGTQQAAIVKSTKIAIVDLEKAAQIFAVDNSGNPPETVDELMVKRDDGTAALLDKIPVDGWGNPLNYEFPNTRAETDGPAIWSNGKDGKNDNGSGDDINNWDDKVQ